MSAAAKINTQHPFLNKDVILNLAGEITNTLKVMANIEARFEKPFAIANWKSPKEISVVLALDTAELKGKIHFHFDKYVAQEIISNLTGSQINEDSEEMLDGVGEISNIFYGAAKTKLNQIGFHLTLSSPHPCWTKDLPPTVGHSICLIIPFKVSDKDCYVEIII